MPLSSTTYPTALDDTTVFPAGSTLHGLKLDGTTDSSPPATSYHSTLLGDNVGAAIIALQTKVGITGSADTGSLVYKAAHAAPIASPTFTGTVTLPTGSLVGSPNNSVGTGVSVSGSVSVENGFLGLCFIGTQQANGACTIDLRSHGGTYASPTATPSGTVIGGMHIGSCYGGTGQPALIDSAQIFCVATETHSSSASGTEWDFYTTPNGTNSKAVAFTIGQDKSLTAFGAVSGVTTLSMGGAISGATNIFDTSVGPSASANVVTAAAGVTGLRAYAFPANLQLARSNGTTSAGTPINNGETIGVVAFVGATTTAASPTMYVGGQISCLATETWSSTAGGTKLTLQVTANTTHSRTTALTLDQDASATFGGTISHASLLNCTSNFAVGTTKFTVAASTGNTAILGTLDQGSSGQLSSDASGNLTATSAAVTGALTSSSASAGLGYTTGAGGTVTQITSKSTTVVLNKICGKVQTSTAQLNGSTSVRFTLTNSAIAIGDVVAVCVRDNGGSNSSYVVGTDGVAAGSCVIHLRNVSANNLSDAVVINFAVIKAVTA